MFFQLFDDRPHRLAGKCVEVKTAKHICLSCHHADPFTLRARYHADTAPELVLGGQPSVKKRNDVLFGAAHKRHPHKYARHTGAAALYFRYLHRCDAVFFACVTRFLAVHLRVVDHDVDLVSTNRVDLLELTDQVSADLHVVPRYFGADKRLNENRPLYRNLVYELTRVFRKRMKPFASDIETGAAATHKNAQTNKRYRQRCCADQLMSAHFVTVGFLRPMPAAQKHYV